VSAVWPLARVYVNAIRAHKYTRIRAYVRTRKIAYRAVADKKKSKSGILSREHEPLAVRERSGALWRKAAQRNLERLPRPLRRSCRRGNSHRKMMILILRRARESNARRSRTIATVDIADWTLTLTLAGEMKSYCLVLRETWTFLSPSLALSLSFIPCFSHCTRARARARARVSPGIMPFGAYGGSREILIPLQ